LSWKKNKLNQAELEKSKTFLNTIEKKRIKSKSQEEILVIDEIEPVCIRIVSDREHLPYGFKIRLEGWIIKSHREKNKTSKSHKVTPVKKAREVC